MLVSNDTASDKHIPVGNAIMEFMDRTGYTVFIVNGQRITQIENPGKEYPIPGDRCEVYFSHFPKDALEDTLFPLFSRFGKVLQMRLMMHFSGLPKGYGYAVYASKRDADRAVSQLNELKMNGHVLKVCKSLNSKRLFVNGLPNNCNANRLACLISNLVDGVTKVAYFRNYKIDADTGGYCFVDFETHQVAIKSKSVLRLELTYKLKTPVRVTWARPETDVDDDFSDTKTMFIRGLEGKYLDKSFIECAVKKVVLAEDLILIKTIRHFCFVYFRTQAATEATIDNLNGKIVGGQQIEAAFARPLKRKTEIKTSIHEGKDCVYTDN